MIWLLLGAHVVLAGLLPSAARRLGPGALLVGAIPPALTTAWAVARLGADEPASAELAWVPGLDLGLVFLVGDFSVVLTLLVAGIGTLVFVYAAGYFRTDHDSIPRFAPALLAFAGSMIGLVWAESVWTFFVFWELTSVTSFLLVGHKRTDPAALTAARRAFLITGLGGLVLLAGLLVLADAAGTDRLSQLDPVSGGAASLAAILIMIGAATKSAQVPFHVWLPGAMAAPTPVSAYLHSATMVKAGVVLVAVAGPAFGDVAWWQVTGLAFGVTSVLWGAVGALRHRDAKLVLAWGTVSQLGLLITLLSAGSAKAVFAAVSLLVAHALFKAALFLVVGEIDLRAGTRDIDELGGLARSMPIAFAVALAAGLSMAGAPPLLGFAAKEAAIEAALGLDGTVALVVGLAVIGGSVLTVAYTVRFLVAVFGSGPDTEIAPWRPGLSVPSVVLAVAGLVGFLALGSVSDLVRSAAVELDPGAEVYSLLRWPGFTTAASLSAAVLVVGSALGFRLSSHDWPVLRPIGAKLVDRSLDQMVDVGRWMCARLQHGSLPVYVVTLGMTAIVATVPFLVDVGFDHLVLWSSPVQGVVALAVVVAAVAVAIVDDRIGAGLALGAVGVGISAFFVLHGAPDLVLTQLLVETVIVVAFVVGFGPLSRRFPPVGAGWRQVRLAIAGLGALAVMGALAATSARPVGEPPIEGLVSGAVEEGGGDNVVNVILTDIRALDTLGEVVVLATVAVGIVALVRAGRPEVST